MAETMQVVKEEKKKQVAQDALKTMKTIAKRASTQLATFFIKSDRGLSQGNSLNQSQASSDRSKTEQNEVKDVDKEQPVSKNVRFGIIDAKQDLDAQATDPNNKNSSPNSQKKPFSPKQKKSSSSNFGGLA